MKFRETKEILLEDLSRISTRKGGWLLIIKKACSNSGFRAVTLYRIGRYFYMNGHTFLASLCQRLMHHLAFCWISVGSNIGPGFLIAHVGSLVIGGGTRIGRNCDVRQNVTFGGNYNKTSEDGRTQPWLEDNISIGVGAVIIGPVRIGSNTIIGANTVVTKDIPSNSICFGMPVQVIKEKWPEGSDRRL